MVVKNWIVLGIAVAVILAYTVGIPPSFSAEYTKSTQNSVSENNCRTTEDGYNGQPPSEYESLVDNTESTDYSRTYCSNTNSDVQGEGNAESLTSVQR
jgi:hypothetical protein